MRTTFYIQENRIEELKSFIRAELPTARFLQNPYKQGSEFSISLELTVEDGNKLSQLINNWYNQDNPYKSPKKSWLSRLLSNFYCG
jgi:hypothetical protein